MILKTRDAADNMKWKEYNFDNFEVFYIFIQKITPTTNRLKAFKSFNWESDLIKNKFLKFFQSHNKASLSELRKALHCKSDKCIQKEFWIERGWDNYEEKIKEIQSKNANKFVNKLKKDATIRTTSTQLKWWTDKGYTEEEAQLLIKERQRTFTKEKCIEKYGKEKGVIIYQNRQQAWRKSIDEKYTKETQNEWRRKAMFFSNQSSNLFKPFYEKYKSIYTCFLAPYTKEFFVNCGKGFYLYDFVIDDLKLIFEFNGSHVHANPDWSKEKLDNWHHCFNKESAYENIEKYKQKIQAVEKLGYKVVVLWDTNKNNSKIIFDEIEAKLHMLQQ